MQTFELGKTELSALSNWVVCASMISIDTHYIYIYMNLSMFIEIFYLNALSISDIK